MDRRGFFGLIGGLGLAPLAACEVRDGASAAAAEAGADELQPLRDARIPDGIVPAVMFAPLRQTPR